MSLLSSHKETKKAKNTKNMRGLRLTLVLAVILLVACSDGPPVSTQNPPSYPNATKVQERKLGPEDSILNIYRSVTFTTPDTPEAVLVFYREQLETDGWQTEQFQPDPQALLFRWESIEQPPTVYWLDVQAWRDEGGVTQVRIDMRDGVGK